MSIEIGEKELYIPVIQGGMGVGVSLGKLAGSVAREGGMGTISMVNIGFEEEDFYTNTLKANIRAFKKQLDKAKKISKGNGLIAVNIMAALTDYKILVKEASKTDVDAIVVGAGLPLDLPELIENRKILIAPIISSTRALKILVKNWMKKYKRLPDFVVLEGRNAGGHLGFKEEEIYSSKYSLNSIIRETVEYLNEINEEFKKNIPLFVGGSLYDGNDLNLVRKLGGTGIQIGTRFIATNECDVNKNFKELITDTKSKDIVILKSPVGLPARAIKTSLIDSIKENRIPSKKCINCLKTCNPKTTKFCITDALIDSANGDIVNGLFFCGSLTYKINEISTVKNIFNEIKRQWNKK